MKARIIVFLFAAVLLLWACTAGGGSIYYTLENEVKTTDNTLKNTIPIHGIAKLGTDYYVAAGNIWKGASGTDTVSWNTTAPITPPAAGALCTALVEFGGDLYGGFITQSGNLGLYTAAVPSTSTFGGGQIADLLVVNKQVVLLAVVKSLTVPELVVSTASAGDPFVYDLLLSTDGATYASLLGPSVTVTKPFTGVAHTSATGKYWAVAGASLYSGTAGALDKVASPTDATAEEVLTSIFSDDETSRLFVTSNLGFVYYSANEGATWTKNATAEKVGDATVKFLAVAGAPSAAKMLVASDGYGYYVLAVAAPPTLARFAGSTIGLYTASVRRFLIDGPRLFACTNSKGLWRNESFNPADCSTVESWIQE